MSSQFKLSHKMLISTPSSLAGLLTIFICVIQQNVPISAVNSPQMIFYTPFSGGSFIHLESKYGYSATLKLRRPKPFLSTTLVGNNVSTSNDQKISEFTVLGPEYPYYGVTAVIQKMNLRTSNKTNGCIDFVQFASNGSMSSRSNPVCGHIGRNEDWIENSDPRLQRSFFSPNGVMHIYFHSDQTNNDPMNIEMDRDIGVEVVFTSYTICPNPLNSWKKLKPCSKTEKMSCIYNTLFCDNKINCGFPGEFGHDEEGCYFPYLYVTVSVVAGISLTIALIYLFIRWVTTVPKNYQQ